MAIFLDNASTTRVLQEILNDFNKINEECYFNPSSLYFGGRKSRELIENARKTISEQLNADKKSSVIFTGSATESNNMVFHGFIKKNTRKILVSVAEHPSVYNVALDFKNKGYNVEFVKINKDGVVDIDDYKSKLDATVDFISIMHVNNETGAVNDIAYLVSLAREVNPNVIFHSDGVQAVGKINVDLEVLDVDLYSISAHKIHGLKGAGALYVKNPSKIKPMILGGNQESGLRSGTENIFGIYSLSRAIEESYRVLKKSTEIFCCLKDEFLKKLSDAKIKYVLHSNEKCVPNIISISFVNCRAETILNMLSDKGVYVGNGSACSSKKSDNRILENMGVSKSDIEGNLRVSFSRFNTVEEIDEFVVLLQEVVKEYLEKAR